MVVKQDTRAKKIFKSHKNFKGVSKKKPNPTFKSGADQPENGSTVNNPKVHLVSQEIKFAKTLAGNDPALRQKNLNKFKKWLKIRSESSYPFTDADFLRLWQGLFYCMWMSDKPLTQEALAEDIASLVHSFTKPMVAVQFYGTFLKTMCDGWFGIDQWRIDKFMMLVRRVTRQMFKLLKTHEWNIDLVKGFRSKISPTILAMGQHNYAGLTMHYSELYLEELAKISGGDVPPLTVGLLIKPFAEFIENSNDRRLLEHIKDTIFYQLIKQSDLGRDYQERYEIWKEAGCPTESVDDCIIKEKIIPASDDEEADETKDDEELKAIDKEIDDIENKPLDPRAGLVDVDIPEIMFQPEQIIKWFQTVMYQPTTRTKNRVVMKNIIGKLEQFMEDRYPFTERGFPVLENVYRQLPNIDKAAKSWQKFEDSLYKDTRKFKKITKHLKHMGKAKRAKAEKVLKKLGGIVGKTNNKENEVTDDIVEEEIISRNERKPYRNTWMEEDVIEERGGGESSGDSFIKRRPKNKKEAPKKQNKTMPPTDVEEKDTPLKLGLKRRSSINTDSPKTTKPSKQTVFNTDDAWSQPLQDGEVEIFLPSRKAKLAAINKPIAAASTEGETEIVITPKKKKLLLNPFAASKSATPAKQKLRGKAAKGAASRLSLDLNSTPGSEKRVKIALDKNCHQDPHEYLKQVKRSPQIPHDSNKRPMKGLLKPNAMPSPINPFYKK